MQTIKFIPKIIGHRGGRGLLYPPENTLAAFEMVIKGNGDGIEFDILKTKDDHLVIFHDDFMHQLTNISQSDIKNAIELYTLNELNSEVRLRRVPKSAEYLDLDESNQITDHQIPSFEQLLDLVVSYKSNPLYSNDSRIQNFLLNVEIKESLMSIEYYKQHLIKNKTFTEQQWSQAEIEAEKLAAEDTANRTFDTVQNYLNSGKLNASNFMISSFDFAYLKVIQERNEKLSEVSKRLPIGALICRHGAINDTDHTDMQNGIDRLIKLGIKPQSINLPVICFIKSPSLADQLRQLHTRLGLDKPLQILAWPYKEQSVSTLNNQQKEQLVEMINHCQLDYLLSDNPIEMKQDVFNSICSN